MSAPLDAVPGATFTLTEDMRIAAANRAMADLVGRDAAGLEGESIDALLSAPSRILFQTHVYPALRADGRVEEVFLTIASSDGQPIPVLLNATRIADAGPSIYQALMVRIRARARWETELLDATRALERERAASQRLADELAATAQDLAARHAEERRVGAFRDAFIGIVSHELRTPITTIYGMSQVLLTHHDGMDRDVLRDRLHDIESEAERLRRLTEDLLVLSRAEGGRLEVTPEPIVLRHVVQRAVDGERGRSPGHTFVVDLDGRLPLVVGDDLYVEQVVRNYLSNAVKYSPPDTTVRIAVTADDGGASVRVADEGPGLPPGDPAALFDLFYRAPSTVRQAPGAGIGLFVCRALIAAMGGRVWAAPALAGHGAEFGFWLPQASEGDSD